MIENQNVDSVWKATAPDSATYPALESREEAEVVIIGGGFCGLSAAVHLGQVGRSVVVLESHAPGWGASGRNGGQVIPGLKKDPDELSRLYGPEQGEALAELAGTAPNLVFDLIHRYKIVCQAQRAGWIQLALGPKGLDEIKNRVRQWRQRGIDVEVLDQSQVHALTGASGYIGGLLDRRGGTLNPLAYARGLAEAAVAIEARMYARSRVISIQRTKGRWVVRTSQGQVSANNVLLCTNAYTDGIWPKLEKSIVPFVSGAVATQPLPDDVRGSILKEGQAAADNARLLSWFGLDSSGRLIFGGRTGTWSETNRLSDYENRIKRMHDVFPQVKNIPVQFYWSGKVALTADYLPHIHKLAPGLHTGLGFNGRGVAMATMMGKLLAACVEHGNNETSFPLTDLRPLPLHAVRKPIVQSVVYWKKLMDRINP